MHHFLRSIFPTLVLIGFTLIPALVFAPSSASALPTDPSPDSPAMTTRESREPETNQELLKSRREMIDITVPPRISGRPQESGYFYKFHHELSAQIGELYDTEARGRENHVHPTLLFGYLFPISAPGAPFQPWELTGAYINDGTGTLAFARRFISSQDRFRPYLSLGVGLHLLPEDQLANFSLWRQYQLRGACGFEWTVFISGRAYHWRAEALAAVSARSQQGDLTVGYVWAW